MADTTAGTQDQNGFTGFELKHLIKTIERGDAIDRQDAGISCRQRLRDLRRIIGFDRRIFRIKAALGAHQVNTINPVAALEIMNLIAHRFDSSRAIRPQYMRKVGFHAKLFSEPPSRSNGSQTPTPAVSTRTKISSVASCGTGSFRGLIFSIPPNSSIATARIV